MKNRVLIIALLTIMMFAAFIGVGYSADIPKRLSDVERITVEKTSQLMQKEEVVIVDTRAPGQWVRAKDKMPGAIRIQNMGDLTRLKETVPSDRAIVTYCT